MPDNSVARDKRVLKKIARRRKRGRRPRIITSSGMLSSPNLQSRPRSFAGPTTKGVPAADELNDSRETTESVLDEKELEQIGVVTVKPPPKLVPPPVPKKTGAGRSEADRKKPIPRTTTAADETGTRARRESSSLRPRSASTQRFISGTVADGGTRSIYEAESEATTESVREPAPAEMSEEPLSDRPTIIEEEYGPPVIPESGVVRVTGLAVGGIVALALVIFGIQQLSSDETDDGYESGTPSDLRSPLPEAPAAAETPAAAAAKPAVAESTITKPAAEQEPPAHIVEDPERGDEGIGQATRVAGEVAPANATEQSGGKGAATDEEAAPTTVNKTAEGATAEDADAAYAEYIAQARKLDDQRRSRKAVALYEQALTVNPNGSEALSRLAFYRLNRGKNREAADYAARALQGDPTSSEAWIVLGAARDALKDRQGSRDAYRKCAEIGKGEYVGECRRMLR
jgi:hypothetical protein